MKRKYFILLITLVLITLVVLIVYPSFHRWARAHVNYITATEDHPLKCTSCHLHKQKTGIIAEIVNADYISPINMAISGDGNVLYVVAEEENSLLMVDTKS